MRSGHGAPMFISGLHGMYRCCEHAGALRHVTGFPGLGLPRPLRPLPLASGGDEPSHRSARGGLHRNPAPIRQVRAGGVLEGRLTLVPCVHLPVTLAGPRPSDGAGSSRLCQGCLSPSPASPGIRLPSATSARCDGPKAVAFHHRTVQQRLVALVGSDRSALFVSQRVGFCGPTLHPHPDAARLSLSGGGHGLGDAHGAFVAAVQHLGQWLLPGGPSGGAGRLRQTGDLQHRPRQPVYQSGVHLAP